MDLDDQDARLTHCVRPLESRSQGFGLLVGALLIHVRRFPEWLAYPYDADLAEPAARLWQARGPSAGR